MPGFRTFVQTGIVLQVGTSPVVPMTLEEGQLTEQVQVKANVAQVEQRSVGVGTVVETQRIVELPLNGREPYQLLTLSGAATQYIGAGPGDMQTGALQISMSAKGNPYDNAFMELFYKTLKYEEVHLWNYETYDDVIERLPFFIEEVYNRKRLHSSIGYVPPNEFEVSVLKMKPADRPVLNL